MDDPTPATEKYKILADFIEQKVSMAKIARQHNLPVRTLWSWYRNFQKEGFSGLNRKGRSDRGQHRKISSELEILIVDELLQIPKPPITLIFQKVKAACLAEGRDPPSYSTVYNAVKKLSG